MWGRADKMSILLFVTVGPTVIVFPMFFLLFASSSSIRSHRAPGSIHLHSRSSLARGRRGRARLRVPTTPEVKLPCACTLAVTGNKLPHAHH
jgi:hypothetical protein